MVTLLKDPEAWCRAREAGLAAREHAITPASRCSPPTAASTRPHWRLPVAGIGFELRKLMRRDSFWGLLRAYGYAGLISSGPWVLSILGVMGIGIFSVNRVAVAGRAPVPGVGHLPDGGVADPDRLSAADVHPLHRRPPVREGGGDGAAQPVRGAGPDHAAGRGRCRLRRAGSASSAGCRSATAP